MMGKLSLLLQLLQKVVSQQETIYKVHEREEMKTEDQGSVSYLFQNFQVSHI